MINSDVIDPGNDEITKALAKEIMSMLGISQVDLVSKDSETPQPWVLANKRFSAIQQELRKLDPGTLGLIISTGRWGHSMSESPMISAMPELRSNPMIPEHYEFGFRVTISTRPVDLLLQMATYVMVARIFDIIRHPD